MLLLSPQFRCFVCNINYMLRVFCALPMALAVEKKGETSGKCGGEGVMYVFISVSLPPTAYYRFVSTGFVVSSFNW